MKQKVFRVVLAFSALLFVRGSHANAQQPEKVARIGYLLSRHVTKHSAKVCATLDMRRGKTFSLSGDLQKEN
jgi:hypothetical protein